MICGKNSWTDCRGTPRQISIPSIIQLVGCLKICKESRRLNLSLTMEELSTCMRYKARAFSFSERNLASEEDLGRYQKAKPEARMVARPSIRKR